MNDPTLKTTSCESIFKFDWTESLKRPPSPTPSNSSFLSSSSLSSGSIYISEHSDEFDLSIFIERWSNELLHCVMSQAQKAVEQYDLGPVTDLRVTRHFELPSSEEDGLRNLPDLLQSIVPPPLGYNGKAADIDCTLVSQIREKLSCPFHQRDPRKHTKYPSCFTTGFDTVHRIK